MNQQLNQFSLEDLKTLVSQETNAFIDRIAKNLSGDDLQVIRARIKELSGKIENKIQSDHAPTD